MDKTTDANTGVFVESRTADHRAGSSRTAATQGHAPNNSVNIPRVIHRALRGRYPLAIILGILFGGAAGVAAWRLGHPTYESQGLIRIANALPIVVTRNDLNDPMPMMMFDTFMQSQKLLISSRRMVDAAVRDPVWQAMGKSVPEPPDQFFANEMKVDARSRSEIIQVSVDDKDPGTAAAAVTSIVNAFSEYYNSEEKRTERERSSVLFENRDKQTHDIDTYAKNVQALSQQFGGIHPELACERASQQVEQSQSRLDELERAIGRLTRPATATGPNEASDSGPSGTLTPEQLAFTDQGMRSLLDEQYQAERELRRLSSKYGKAHPQILAAQDAVENVQERIARQAVFLNDFRRIAAAQGGGPAGPQLYSGRSLEELKDTEKTLSTQLTAAKQELNKMAEASLRLQQNEESLRRAKDELSRTNERIDSLRTEGALGGRLTVLSSGDIPISPAKDLRPRLAAGAGAGGLCLPASVLVIYSLIRRRYRFADDTESEASSNSVPLLGVLPELRKNATDPDTLATASHCVHQIRVSLNATSDRVGGGRAYLVTSATAGEGKTTLTTSLGLSFAASRVRTLIIDADLVGRKLTTSFRARDVEGLHEAIAAGTIRQRVRRTDSGLYIMTAGQAGAPDACALPRAAIQAVIEEARCYFDIVLIDSGPVMGSIEASMIAPEVDGVIFAISRGQSRQAADVAMRRLRRIGATVVGCVFNRAKSHDMITSHYGSSSRMSLPDPNQPARAAAAAFVAEDFGPVVQAVASAMPVGSVN